MSDNLKLVGSLVVDMLRELPPDDLVWAIIGRKFSASEMIVLIDSGSAEGQQYVIDTMRVARDILRHSARNAS